jgi:hypothetical protein
MSIGSIFNGIATAFLGAAAQKSTPGIDNYFQGRRARGVSQDSTTQNNNAFTGSRSRQIAQTPSQSGRSRQIASAPGIKGRLRGQRPNYGPQNPVDPFLALISQANKTGAVS